MKNDPSRIQNSRTTTDKEVRYRIELEKFFAKSSGSYIEKLQNFAKYVPRQSLAIFLAKYELMRQILDVHGSIIEGGVYLGAGLMSFAQLSAILEPYNHQRRVIGFDTFSGFTELSPQDRGKKSEHSKRGGLTTSPDEYKDLLKCVELFDANRFLTHIPKVTLVKGDAARTIPKYLKDNPHTVVSMLYLDFDVYAPTKVAIETFLPRMPKGAIIAFDEINVPFWPGETQALAETAGISNLRLKRFPFEPQISYAVIQ